MHEGYSDKIEGLRHGVEGLSLEIEGKQFLHFINILLPLIQDSIKVHQFLTVWEKRHQNMIIDLKVKANLLKRWILAIDEIASGSVCSQPAKQDCYYCQKVFAPRLILPKTKHLPCPCHIKF